VPDQPRLTIPDAVAQVQLALAPGEPAALHYLGADVLQVAANVRPLTISTNSAIALKRVFIWFSFRTGRRLGSARCKTRGLMNVRFLELASLY
jgi:hypothetical protein